MKLLYLALALALFSGCGAFSGGVENGKARVAASQQLPIKSRAFAKIVPLDGGNFVIAGFSPNIDSILLMRFDDSLHVVWSKGIPENMSDKLKAYYLGNQSKVATTNGDLPDWSKFYAVDGSLMLPINSTKDKVTAYHALQVDLKTGNTTRDIPIATLPYDSLLNPADHGYVLHASLWDNEQFRFRSSPDGNRLLFYNHHLSGNQASFDAKLFDRSLNSLGNTSWNVQLDSTKEHIDGVLPDNSRSILVFIRNKEDKPSSLRVIRHSMDGGNDELAIHPTFGTDTTIKYGRIRIGMDGRAYYACSINKSDDVEGAALAMFDFGTHATSFHRQMFQELSNGVLQPVYMTLADSVIVLSFEHISEYMDIQRWQSETIYQTKLAYGDVAIAAFDLDGNPTWSTNFEKDQNWCPGYTQLASPNHAISYWFRDKALMQRRVFSLKNGKTLSDKTDEEMLRMGGQNNSDPDCSVALNDGSFLIYTENGMMSRDSWIYKVVE
jgi:hypothetical protein